MVIGGGGRGWGALLVLAGAGTGKTKVLTMRVANIIRQGLAGPGQIFAVTFTNTQRRPAAPSPLNGTVASCTLRWPSVATPIPSLSPLPCDFPSSG